MFCVSGRWASRMSCVLSGAYSKEMRTSWQQDIVIAASPALCLARYVLNFKNSMASGKQEDAVQACRRPGCSFNMLQQQVSATKWRASDELAIGSGEAGEWIPVTTPIESRL